MNQSKMFYNQMKEKLSDEQLTDYELVFCTLCTEFWAINMWCLANSDEDLTDCETRQIALFKAMSTVIDYIDITNCLVAYEAARKVIIHFN